MIWTPKGMAATFTVAGTPEGYDCVGLVKSAVVACGGPDLRPSWNAQTLFDKLPMPTIDEQFMLRLYGSKARIEHVAFDLGNGLRLEAAGGTHTTVNLAASQALPNAFVRIGFEVRSDFVAYRSLAALEAAKP